MCQSLGSAVFGGMLGVTGFGLIFTPAFYTLVQWIGATRSRAPSPSREPLERGQDRQNAAMEAASPPAESHPLEPKVVTRVRRELRSEMMA